ncbi:DNA replication protein [Pseudomonas coronafaciens pv. atropurpurea]|nr:DNA replication protein [Pseudomonas coronafaciens pv. atropurpurea]
MDKSLSLQLGSGRWLREGLSLIIGGQTGLGKTWLACSLAHKACREGDSVRYLYIVLFNKKYLTISRIILKIAFRYE